MFIPHSEIRLLTSVSMREINYAFKKILRNFKQMKYLKLLNT